MALLDFWEAVNVLARIGVAAIVIIKLTKFRDLHRGGERVGLGIAGGCAILTIPVIWEGQASPFAGWAGAMFAVGILIYFSGRLVRQFRHDRANVRSVSAAKAHVQKRG